MRAAGALRNRPSLGDVVEEFFGEGPYYLLIRDVTPDPANPANCLIHHPLTVSGSGSPDAIAVFTDRDAAEQFAGEQAPEHKLFHAPTLAQLAIVLRGLSGIAGYVARDPYRPGYTALTARIADLTAQE